MTDTITLPRATVQQVLDALERTNSEPGSMAYEREAKASVALEDALRAAPQQQAEPVMLNGMTEVETNATASVLGLTKQAEPIGWLDGNDKLAEFMHRDLKAEHDKRGSATPRDFTVPVYTAPPQRKELSAGEILNMMPSTIPAAYDGELMEFARAIEAKIKEGT